MHILVPSDFMLLKELTGSPQWAEINAKRTKKSTTRTLVGTVYSQYNTQNVLSNLRENTAVSIHILHMFPTRY